MAVQVIQVKEFLQKSAHGLLLDVRSPMEFENGHIPNAISLPIFNNEERAIVGTVYKQQGHKEAVLLGMELFGKKMHLLSKNLEELLFKKNTPQSPLFIHCWRGGKRSEAMAWLLSFYGFQVYLLEGGYKAYRNYLRSEAAQKATSLIIIGGFSGSGKTWMIEALKSRNYRAINLEELAVHHGSTFGKIGMPNQPTQEQFENHLFHQFIDSESNNHPIYLEDESNRIGALLIPEMIYKAMGIGKFIFVQIPFEIRLNRILSEYGKLPTQELINGVLRIQKRLGGLETKNAIEYLESNNIHAAFSILLKYYDKWYLKSLEYKKIKFPDTKIHTIEAPNEAFALEKILAYANESQ